MSDLPAGVYETEDGRYVDENGRYVNPNTGNPLTYNPLMGGNSALDAIMAVNETGGYGEQGLPYAVGEDGNFYNDDGEQLYFWAKPNELGDSEDRESRRDNMMDMAQRGSYYGNYYTMDEIQAAWNADEGMGFFKAANPDLTWEQYQAFLTERQGLIQDGSMGNGLVPYTEIADNYGAMRDDPNSGYTGDASLTGDSYMPIDELENEAYSSLLDKYGIQTNYVNDDGDIFVFNGSSYDKIFKSDDQFSFHDAMGVVAGLAVSVVLGPALTGALTSSLGAAGAKAAASAITSLASQAMVNGEVDLTQALISAATAYGGEALAGSLSDSGVFSQIGDKVDEFKDLVSTGNSIADAAIQAGGMSMLTQLVTTGEVDIQSAAMAALVAGGMTGFQEWKAGMEAAGETVGDDVLQEVVVEAKRVGTDVGGGMTALDNGLVINEAGDIIGNMDDLDLDGDGMLSGNDLQEITTPDRELVDPNLTRDPDSYYDVDGDGQYTEGVDTDLTAPGETTNPDAFTNEWADERYAGLSGDQIIDQMQRDGFTDDQINGYMEHWNATNDLNLQELNTASYGAIDVNMEDKYTIGQTEEGTYYIAKVEENGEVSFTSISEDQYNDLYGEMYGSADTGEGALTSGDYAGVDAYIEGEGIGSTGNEFTGVDPFTGEGVLTEGDGWITLEEGDDTSTAVPIDDFVKADPDPVEPEPVEPVEPVEPEPVEPEETTEQDTTDNQTTSNITTGGADGSQSPSGNPGTPGSTTDGVTDYVPDIPSGTPDTNKVTPTDEVEEGLSNPLTGGPVVDAPTDVTEEVDPADGTGTPAQTTNAQIEALMDRGMTYEQAVANQNAAISAGADADGDGMVTNAEWSAHTGQTGAGETISEEEGSGNDVVSDSTNAGNNDNDDLDPTGDVTNTGGTTGGPDTGSNTTEGPGTTDDVEPGGGGPGPGPGTGPGGGPGGGSGMLGGGGFSGYTPSWGELFGYTPFKVYEPGRGLEPVSGLLKGLLK